MTNPTRQEIIEAYRELYMLLGFYQDRNPERAPKTRAIIENALPPLPRLTMAEVEWDSDKHYLTEAEHPGLSKVIMIDKVFYTEDTYIYVLVTDEDETYGCLASPSNLTPTGHRYTLTEVQE